MRRFLVNYSKWPLLPFLTVLVFSGLLTGCTPALPQFPTKGAVTYKAAVDMRFHGFRRTYLVHLPPAYDPERLLPMVVVVHGAFDTAGGMERFSGFSDLADEENFIALYPNGIGILGYLQHWNAGHCCGKAAADGIDDVTFLSTVIEDACARLAVDRRRIYMVGFSNGGMMTYRFAAERGDLLAGIAPLAASAGGRPDRRSPQWAIPAPVKPLPVLVIHGLADDSVPFEQGDGPVRQDEREYWPVMQSLGIWLASNGCPATPAMHNERQGRVHVATYDHCHDGNNVVLYTIEGWPHIWPGRYFTSDLDPGDPLYNFDAAQIIWAFFNEGR